LAEPAAQRLFVGLGPEPRTRRALAQGAAHSPAHSGRVQHPGDLHVTLVFLGQVTAQQQPCVIDAADQIAAPRFELSIDRLAYWKRPRILCCGPSVAPAVLLDLVSRLQQRLGACGFEAEKRTYSPHVTLARKARRGLQVTDIAPLHWSIRDFCLVASVTAPPGARN